MQQYITETQIFKAYDAIWIITIPQSSLRGARNSHNFPRIAKLSTKCYSNFQFTFNVNLT